MGKGDKRRLKQITIREESLRWELAFCCKNNKARKKEIIKQLTSIQEKKK